MDILSQQDINCFLKDGYVIKKKLFSDEEMTVLQNYAFNDEALHDNAWNRKDASGAASKVSLWTEPKEDVYSKFSRSERFTSACKQLIGESIYLSSTKIMMKEPFVGGAWEWHQDYGYWHNNGFLYPKFVSAMIAINQATTENGCLQVLKGSHNIGRIDHQDTGDQKGANMRFVDAALANHPLIDVELEAGDVLFFHCNLLHKSNQNKSDKSRWSMICAFNAESNQPIGESESKYSPLEVVSDNAILEYAESL